jgi:hypothetical protein
MYSPDVEELHLMARAIRMKRAWFQNKRGRNFPHYDLAPSRRRAAIAAGATAITCREMVGIVRGNVPGLFVDGGDKYVARPLPFGGEK